MQRRRAFVRRYLPISADASVIAERSLRVVRLFCFHSSIVTSRSIYVADPPCKLRWLDTLRIVTPFINRATIVGNMTLNVKRIYRSSVAHVIIFVEVNSTEIFCTLCTTVYTPRIVGIAGRVPHIFVINTSIRHAFYL